MKPIIKNISVIVLIGLIFIWGFIAGIERLIFFNSDQYPDFLLKRTVSLDSNEKMFKLIKLICPQGGADVVRQRNVVYLRCGLFWPTAKITKINLSNK